MDMLPEVVNSRHNSLRAEIYVNISQNVSMQCSNKAVVLSLGCDAPTQTSCSLGL